MYAKKRRPLFNVRLFCMKGVIQHLGTVESVSEEHVVVRVLQSSACGSCAAAGLCRSNESKEKLIDVYGSYPELQVGQQVMVEGKVRQGLKAVVYAYFIPLVLMAITLFVVMYLTGNDSLSAFVSLFSVALYYIGLYLMRNRLSEKFSFKITNFKN